MHTCSGHADLQLGPDTRTLALRGGRLGERLPGRVVEVVGLAGAGKTTLVPSLLRACDAQRAYVWRRGPWYRGPAVRSALSAASLAPRIAGSCLQDGFALPPTLALYRSRRKFVRDELAHVASLEVFLRQMAWQRRSGTGTMVLDEGPVYRLARLRTFGHTCMTRPSFSGWRNRVFSQCAERLDAVVWLEADVPLLVQRIHSRAKRHRGRERPRHELEDFLIRNRDAYDATLRMLAEHAPIPVLRFDTAATAPERIGAEIARALSAPDEPPA